VRFAAATITAGSRIAHARVVSRSFGARHPDIPCFVLQVDDPGCDAAGGEPFVQVSIRDLGIPRLEQLLFRYDRDPLSYACTPWLLRHLLDRGFGGVVFLKQETLVLDRLDDLLEGLSRHPAVVTPHLVAPLAGHDRVSRELNILLSGVFNVGIVAVRQGEDVRAFLDWWADRLSSHCRHAPHEGAHFEQRWLDFLPVLLPGALVLRDARYNVGHWNLRERTVSVRANDVFVNGLRCAVFRFSGYDPGQPVASRYAPALTPDVLGEAWQVFERFGQALDDAGWQETSQLPYGYGTFDNGVPIPAIARAIHAELGEEADRFGDPFQTGRPDSFFAWLGGDAGSITSPDASLAAPVVSRLWYWVYRRRVDLQAVYPDVLGRDRGAFVGWTIDHGAGEIDVPRAFLEPRPA
jgi:hypothetical protein